MLNEGSYRQLVASYRGKDLLADIAASLDQLWCSDYRSSNPSAELFAVNMKSSNTVFTYIFDINLERTIVAYGEPIFSKNPRDPGRMAGHPNSAGPNFHRGHLIAHSIGGGTDINLVPQLGKLNIGQFRILEKKVRTLAAMNVKALYFVRPIYTGDSQTPAMFEQCVIVPPKSLTYALHKNS
jgi:hypothetical protein